MAMAVLQRRELDVEEQAELDRATEEGFRQSAVPLPVAERVELRVKFYSCSHSKTVSSQCRYDGIAFETAFGPGPVVKQMLN